MEQFYHNHVAANNNVKPRIDPVYVPQIEDIRAVMCDGETYLNARDLTMAMKKMSMTRFNSVSVVHFVKMFVMDLIKS